MSLAETDLAIEELAEEIRRDLDERYAFYRMLNATDRVLWRLEALNLAGVKVIPAALRVRFRQHLAEVPRSCLEAFQDSEGVQEVLDSVFEVQERLFLLRDPGRNLEDHEPAGVAPVVERAAVEEVAPEPDVVAPAVIEPAAPELPLQREWFRAWALRRPGAAGGEGVLWSELTRKCSATDRNRRASWLEELVREEQLRAQASARGWRYFAVGESGGG